MPELHGSVRRNYCQKCGKFYQTDLFIKGVPRCPCGKIIKPDVVLYEEGLDNDTLAAIEYISQEQLLIIGGTLPVVFPPPARWDNNGEKPVIINKSPTLYDDRADLVISGGIAKVFKSITEG